MLNFRLFRPFATRSSPQDPVAALKEAIDTSTKAFFIRSPALATISSFLPRCRGRIWTGLLLLSRLVHSIIASKRATDASPIQNSIERHVTMGLTVACAVVFGIGGWAVLTDISGAVIANGTVVVETSAKKVQHSTGGIVRELKVRDGDLVKAGDVLIRLDDTQTRANLAVIDRALDELMARRARLEAERDGAEAPHFLESLTSRLADAEVSRIIAGERTLFSIRRKAKSGQKSQLTERIGQLSDQVQGASEQILAKGREIELVSRELEGIRELWRKNLVSIQRVTSLERDATRLQGERGALIASVAQLKGKITETEMQILQVDEELRSEVGKELAEIRAKATELTEKRIAALDQLNRVDIRAPQDGVVHQLGVHTIGGVVGAGEQMMLVVPRSDSLALEAKIAPQDVDQLRPGQRAVIRFSAFNQRTTPEISGEVKVISADVSHDQKTGLAFYTVRVGWSGEQGARLAGLKLIPGMPAETFVKTESRNVISYLTKPLADQISRAWREQ